MAKTKTSPWNAADHLKTGEDMAAYLEAASEEGDPELVAAVLGDIAHANMTQYACEEDLVRDDLCRSPRQRAVQSTSKAE